VTRRQTGCRVDFIFGLAEPDDRLTGRLRRALAQPVRERAFAYAPPAGDAGLRGQIARRLQAARGISRPADHIVVTNGAQQALDLTARLLIGPGDAAIVEDPGYEAAAAAFRGAGATLIHARVDAHGLDVARLPVRPESVRLVYTTPSHQFPTGVVMSAARRYALLAWAKRHRAIVLEDDYDGEFRYAGQPIPALAALDAERVVYCGTFAKSLFPSCRLGYLVLPPGLVDAAAHVKWLMDRGSSRLIERAIAHLLETGEYDRHIRRMHRRYNERRLALIAGLQRYLGSAVEIAGDNTGLHLVAWLPALPPDRVDALVAACRARGEAVYSIAPYGSTPPARAGLIFGYGVVRAADIPRAARVIAQAYRQTLP
jgi:GntR family transcriptional regulator/MocR family aminotransferase